MRKIIVVVALVFIFCGTAKAERNITLNKVEQIIGTIYFNPSVRVKNDETGKTVNAYYQLGIRVGAVAASDDGFMVDVSSDVVFGQLRVKRYTAKESWEMLPNVLKPIYRDVYEKAIGVDLSN